MKIQDIENHKLLSDEELNRDLRNLINGQAFAGNPFLYHFQLKNLMQAKREGGRTLYEIYADKTAWAKLLQDTSKRGRMGPSAASNVFECYRINHGSIVMFKANTAKRLYEKYNATSVLDPTAGWGGRMLGAWVLGIDYTGIDTNISLMPAYRKMMAYLESPRLKMLYGDCLQWDYSNFHYDFVLTSPPYVNLELYEHMPIWHNDQDYFENFFVPLWHKCVDNCQPGGHVAINISPYMYEKAINYIPECDTEENLTQQLGQNIKKKGIDKVYVWKV